MIKTACSLVLFFFMYGSVTFSQSAAYIHMKDGEVIRRLIKSEKDDHIIVLTNNNKGTAKYYRSKIQDIIYLSAPEISITDDRYTYTTSVEPVQTSDPDLEIYHDGMDYVVRDAVALSDIKDAESRQYRKWLFIQKIELIIRGIDPALLEE